MKIAICDDQAIVRDGLEMILSIEADIEIIGLAQNGIEAVQLAFEKSPDLILMDLKMKGMAGAEATRRIKLQFPHIKILVLTTYNDDDWVRDAIRAGADGYLLKDTPRERLLEAIRGTMEGKTFLDPQIAGKILGQMSMMPTMPSEIFREKLTSREEEVLSLLGRGMSNAEIASRLYLSEGTVRNRISTLFSKLNISDRTQAAIIAIQYGLTNDGSSKSR